MATMLERGSVLLPNASTNQVDGLGAISRQSEARRIVEDHMRALRARRQIELIWEKLLLHVDGTGDFQWADILDGTRVDIPRFISEYRKTENLLRPIVENAVSQHTASPIRYAVEAPPDLNARERAIMDTVFANHLADTQDWNTLFADVLFMAYVAGFCTAHAYWRDTALEDWYEPLAPDSDEMIRRTAPVGPGMVDCFMGNPFGHVFNEGAKRDSWEWASYERVVSAERVRQQFGHLAEARALEGSTRIPSAAEFERIVRSWNMTGVGRHGFPMMQEGGGSKGEELITLVCRELGPDLDPRFPDGRLQLVAVPGDTDLRRGHARAQNAVMLADMPLPGREFSFTVFHTGRRGDSIYVKPWVEDLDQIQVDLNIALSKQWEAIVKQLEAPIVTPGGAIAQDMTDVDGYSIMEVDGMLGSSFRPRVMEWPQVLFQTINTVIQEKRQALYTLGGYQAVSRGEAPGSRTPYRAIVALQQADRNIHTPVNLLFRKAAQDFAQRCWKQMKAFGDVPWLISIAGDEYAHLIDSYLDKTKLSEHPPRYKLVSAFGANPEMRAQEMMELVQLRGADGQPLLRTEEFRRQYPNQTIFDQEGDPRHVQRRRARTIARAAKDMARRYRQQTGFDERQYPPQWRRQAVMQVAYQVAFGQMGPMGEVLSEGLEQLFPRLRDDDLMAHISAYSEVIQDETADPIARFALQFRQETYFQWQAMMAQGMGAPVDLNPHRQQPQLPAGGGQSQRPFASGEVDQRGIAAETEGAPEEKVMG